jgi:hypothetical protein
MKLVRGIRALVLLCLALALAYVAGWAMPGTELSAPAAVASFSCLAMAVLPAPVKAPKAPKAAKTEG